MGAREYIARYASLSVILMLMAPVLLLSGPQAVGPLVSGAPLSEPPTRAEDINNITLFMHNVSDLEASKTLPGAGSTWNWFDTVADFNEVNTTLTASGTNNRFDWYLYPALAGNVTAKSISLKIWAKAGLGSSQNANIQVEVYERTSDGSEVVAGTLNLGSQTFPATGTLWTWTLPFPTNYTFHTGSSIKVRLNANPGTSKIVYFYYDSLAANSRVVIRTADHINVAAIEARDFEGTPRINFDPIASNKTMELWTRIDDPYGGYDIVQVTITLIDPHGVTVIDNENMTKVSGTPIDLSSGYSYGWDYSGMPSGKYDIVIWALDNSGYNNYHHFALYTYGEYPVTGTSFFYIGGLPFFVWVKAVDDHDLPLGGAVIDIYSGDSPVFDVVTTDDGMANLTLYMGMYTLKVYYQDVLVLEIANLDIFRNMSADAPLSLECGVYYPTLTIVDSHLEPLFRAHIYLTHPNGTKLDPVQTDEAGNCSFSRLPAGDYGVIVLWRGVGVVDTTVNVADSLPHVIQGAVYYLTVNVMDLSGAPLANIGVTAFEPVSGFIMDFRMTNASGTADLRVPAGPIILTAYWMNMPVATSQEIAVEGDMTIDLVCNVFTADFLLVDSRNGTISGAFVSLYAGSDLIGSDISDNAGNVSIDAYAGTFRIEVVWMGVVVKDALIDLAGPGTVIVQCSVFYIDALLVDSRNLPVDGATLEVVSPLGGTMASVVTNATGSVILRLPIGSFPVVVTWKGVVVNETVVEVALDGSITLTLAIYYFRFYLRDSRNETVDGAFVSIYTIPQGELLGSDISDDEGTATIKVYAGSFELKVVWMGVSVKEAVVDLTGPETILVRCTIFYIDAMLVDSRGAPVEGASVEITSPLNGTLSSALSDNDGMVLLRIPKGSFPMSITWRDVVVNATDISVTSDETLRIIQVSVIYVTFHLRDARQVPVEDADVGIVLQPAGEQFETQRTGADGNVMFRVPAAEYSTWARWMSVVVHEGTWTLTADVALTMDCRIYYLTVTALSKDREAISNVVITVTSPYGNFSERTNRSGMAEFRLPEGQYHLEARLTKTVMLKKVELSRQRDILLDRSLNLEIEFDNYPPSFFVTPLFTQVCLPIVIALLLIILLAVLLFRKREGEGISPPEEEEEEGPEEATEEEEAGEEADEEEEGIEGPESEGAPPSEPSEEEE